MKKLVTIVGLVVLLAAFFVHNPIRFNLSEERINQYLIERADSKKFHRDIEIPNVARVNIKLSDMTVEVGRREPNIIQFNAKANLSFSSLFGDKETVMAFSLSGTPSFDKNNKAIYVNSVDLITISTESRRVNQIMPLIEPILQEALSRYFEEHPIYELNPDKRLKEWLAYHYGSGIGVMPGSVTIYFGK